MSSSGKSLIKPPALRSGDTIALIRPASRLEAKLYEASVSSFRKLGFCVAEYPKKLRSDPFFAASDEDRANELHWALSEPGIRAIFVCRGGYGCERALSQTTSAMRKKWKPKIVIGYSDVTYLHQFLQTQMGWISFHGPLVGFLEAKSIKKLAVAVQALSRVSERQTWSEVKNIGSQRKVVGRLVGGNLSLFQTSGPAALPKEPILLLIEEINENYYRVDRQIRSLIHAGYGEHVRGVILGTMTQCGKADSKTFGFKRIVESLKELTRGPIWMEARFGHGLDQSSQLQRIIPLGCRAEMSGKQLRMIDGVVS